MGNIKSACIGIVFFSLSPSLPFLSNDTIATRNDMTPDSETPDFSNQVYFIQLRTALFFITGFCRGTTGIAPLLSGVCN